MRPRLIALLGVALLLIGCNDSSGPGAGLSLSRIAGTWDLTAWDALLVSDTTQQVDQLAGATLTLTITPGGSAIVSVDFGGEVYTFTVRIAVQGNRVILTSEAGEHSEYGVTLPTESSMSWLGVATDTYIDVDGDGTLDITRERYHWEKI